jgi:glycosyltransferase involved in cell wall biosynthesis
VLHVRPRLGVGGATEYLIRLAESQAAAGHRVTVASGGGDWNRRVRAFATTYDDLPLVPRVGPGRSLPNLPALVMAGLRLARIVRFEQVAIINTHHRFAALAGRVAARLTRVPLVSTLAEVPWHQQRLTRLAIGTLAVTMSDMMRRFVIETCGIPAARVFLVPFGIDVPPALSAARRTQLRDELRLDGAAPLIGCVARLVSRKGHIYLLRAMPEVLRAHPQTQLVLVGDGDERASLEQAAHELGVAHRVVFTGARSDAVSIMAMCDFTVLPSLEEEFGIAITESFACRRTVVATSVGGIPEHVFPMENGLLVPSGDSAALAAQLIRLLADPALARRLGEGGFRTVEQHYTRQRLLERTDAVYRAALHAQQEVA